MPLPPIAHSGGFDEILIALAVVWMVALLLREWRRKRNRDDGERG